MSTQFRSMREKRPEAKHPLDITNELAQDAATELINRIAQFIRYKTGDYPTVHSFKTFTLEGTEVAIVFSASLIPVEHIDEYGKDFAPSVKEGIALIKKL